MKLPDVLPFSQAFRAVFSLCADNGYTRLSHSGDYHEDYANKEDFDLDMANCLSEAKYALSLPDNDPELDGELYALLETVGWSWERDS